MVENATIKIYGMTCTLCSAIIEAGVEKLAGVEKVNVSYAAEKAALQYDPSAVELGEIKKTIEKLGFFVEEGELADSGSGLDRSTRERNKLKKQFIVSAILSSPLLLAMILGGLGFCHDTFNWPWLPRCNLLWALIFTGMLSTL